MSDIETVILCTHDGQHGHLWQPGGECPDAIPAGTWSVRPAALTDATDPRFTDGQRAHLARFEAAPAAPESFDPIAALRRVEALAAEYERTPAGTTRDSDVALDIRDALAPESGR